MTEETLEQAIELRDAIEARGNDIEMVDEKREWCRLGDKSQKMVHFDITLSNERMMQLLDTMQELLRQDEQMYMQQFQLL